MATYSELFDLMNNNPLLNKIAAAVAVQADVVRAEDGATVNHTNRLLWARDAFNDPLGMAKKMTPAVIATNRAATKAQIEAATDAAILSAVAAVVDIFATGA